MAVVVIYPSRPPRRTSGERLVPTASASTCGPQLPSGPAPDFLASTARAANYAVSVTPDGDPASALPNSTGNTVTFQVANTGTCPDTFDLTYSVTGPITGVSLNPTFIKSGTVTATYSVGAGGTGRLTVSASGRIGGAGDDGYYNVTVPYNGPAVSLAPHDGDYRDVTKCVAACFDAVAGYSTPPYFSWDAPHSVHLVYRSSQAYPTGVVQVNAWDTTAVHPVKMSLQLKRQSGASMTFTNNSTELFFACDSTGGAIACDSTWNRLAGQFADSTLPTSDSLFTAVVRSYRADNSFKENDVPVRVFVVNERNSPFGAGWTIGGFQHLYTQLDGTVVITEGNGSIALFTNGCTGQCTWTSPKGDFTTLTSVANVGADSAKYTRRYPDGTMIAFYTNGRLDYVKDRFSNQITFKYNTSQLLVAIVDPAGKADSVGYVSNKLRWIKDPGGRVDSITVDGSGNLTRIRDWAGGVPFTGTYDTKHRLTHSVDRRGGAWGLTYDFASKVANDTAPQITANGQPQRPVVRYASLEKAVLIDTASHLGSSGAPGPHVDARAVRATVTNAKGFSTSYALDRFGATTLVQGPRGQTATLLRDSNSLVLRDSAPTGHIVRYTWSGPDLVQQWDSTTQRKINYSYETTYHQVTKVYGDVDTVWNYWSSGHLDSSRVAGAGLTRYFYAATGRMASDTDPAGHYTKLHYQTGGFQNTDTVYFTVGKVSAQYDSLGQRIKTTDQTNGVTTVVYDSIGRALKSIGRLHDTTTSTYDALYRTQLRDAKGQVYRFWPNALGWADSTTDPGSRFDRFAYDLNGNRVSWTNRRGQVIQTTYDSLDQVRSVVAGGKTTTFFTDPAGRYQAAADSESVDTLWFDGADRPRAAVTCRMLVSGSAPQCFRDSSVYDIHDLDTTVVVSGPAGWGGAQFTVGYHYDPYLRLDTLRNFAGEKATFAYNPEGLLASHTLLALNNLYVSHDYVWTHSGMMDTLSDTTLNAALGWGMYFDSAGRVIGANHGPWATPDRSRRFVYDSSGQLVAYGDSAWTYNAAPEPCTRSLAGDPCPNRTQNITLSAIRSGKYAYDSVGNRKDTLVAGGGLDPGNRLRRWGNYRMDYDATGNLVAKRTLKATDTMQVVRRDSLFWSALGLLDSVRTLDSLNTLARVGFGYDASGRRIRKSTTGGTSRYLWHGDALVMELDSLGNRKAEYTYYPGVDNPESVRRHDRWDTTYYYHQDGARNVVALLKKIGTSNAIAAQYDSLDPFGNGQTSGGPAPNPLQFAGREYDAETGLNYLRGRYYDPAVGRFVSEDPAGLGAGMNQFAYAANDPGDSRDPSGLAGCKTECGDPDGMVHRLWVLSKEGLGANESVNWGLLLNFEFFSGLKGVPTIDILCDASGCGPGSTVANYCAGPGAGSDACAAGALVGGCGIRLTDAQCAQIWSKIQNLNSSYLGQCRVLGFSATVRYVFGNFAYFPLLPNVQNPAAIIYGEAAGPFTILTFAPFVYPEQDLQNTIAHEEAHHAGGGQPEAYKLGGMCAGPL